MKTQPQRETYRNSGTGTPWDPFQIVPIVTDLTCTLAQCLEQQWSLAVARDWKSSPW